MPGTVDPVQRQRHRSAFAEKLEAVVTVEIVEIVDGKISNFYAMRNPDKLAAVTTAHKISRG